MNIYVPITIFFTVGSGKGKSHEMKGE